MSRPLKLTLAFVTLQLVFAQAAVARTRPSHVEPRAHAPRSTRAYEPAAQRRRGRRRAAAALAPGVWGGRHIRFEVTASGAAIEYDCGHGTVNGRILPDSAGRFDVAGTHYEEHGGPVRLNDPPARGYPVRVKGRVGGSLMHLTVTRGRTLIGTFDLARDREPELTKCR
jgi:hypothetical protein